MENPEPAKARAKKEVVLVEEKSKDKSSNNVHVPPESSSDSSTKEIASAEPKLDSKITKRQGKSNEDTDDTNCYEDNYSEKDKNSDTGNTTTYTIEVKAYKEEDIGKFLLGGYYDDTINFIPSTLNYSYQNLTRKPNLQKPDNYCLKFRSPDAERIFHRLWNDGDFEVEVELTEDKSNKTSVFVWTLLPFDDDDIELLDENGRCAMMCKHKLVQESSDSIHGMFGDFTNKPMKAMFTQRQLEALRTRITHRLFRECGSLFSELWRDTILERVASDCQHRGYWYDMIDIGMILADTAMHLGSPRWYARMLQVAEAFKTKGKFDLAAEIYEDLLTIKTNTEDFPALPPAKHLPETYIRINLGCVLKFIGDWNASLKAFVEAMHADCCFKRGKGLPLDLTESYTQDLIKQFWIMLFHFAHKDGGIVEAKLHFSLFTGLLSKSGYKLWIQHLENFWQVAKLCEGMLLPSIRKKKKAIQRLRTLYESSSVKDFQFNIISCKDPKAQGNMGMTCFLPEEAESMLSKKRFTHNARNDQMWSRLSVFEANTIKPTCPFCDNPSCQEKGLVHSRLLDCSECHIVRYCCKQCQVQHWPAHKRECKKWRKEK